MKQQLLLLLFIISSLTANAQFSTSTAVGFDYYNQAPKFDIADVDGDNDLDFIISGHNILTSQHHTDLYKNDGTGNFVKDAGVSATLIDSEDGSVAFADIDGDLDQDVLITGITSSGLKITMYRNDGVGVFTVDAVQSANLVAVNYSTIKFADIDGDTDLDLAIMGEDNLGTSLSKIYTNDGSGNFTEDTVNSAIIYDASSGDLDFADVDGDNDLDLLILGYGNGEKTYLYLNDGFGNFTEDTVASTTIQDYEFGASVFVDIDGDTDLDLIIGGSVGSSSSTKMYTNDGSGVFTSVTDNFSNYIYYGDIAVSDVDLDGDIDVFMSGTLAPSTSSHETNLYKNDGSGNFTFDATESAKFYKNFNNSTIFKDLNNDGNEELIISNNSAILIYKNNSIQPIPEINIKGNNIDIVSGDTSPNVADGTDFEVLCNGDSKTNTFTIQNLLGADLEVTSITLSGIGAGDYVISGVTLPLTVTPLASTTFNITFMPTVDGSRTATITVNNNDTDESVYTFDVTGEKLPDVVVSATTGTFECSGGNDIITTSLSEVGLNYYLRNDLDNSIVDGPVAGTGSGLSLDTGILTEDTTFNMFATSTTVRGLKFDGVNESVYSSASSGGSMNAPNAITLESWVKFDGLGDRKPVIHKASSPSNFSPYHQYTCEIRPNGEIYFGLAINGSLKGLQTTGVSLPVNTWAHIACTWDGTTMRIYINGVPYSGTTTVSGTITSYSTLVYIGSQWNQNYGEMTLDDVRIWKTARTEIQIVNHKDTELAGNESNLILYWKLNESSGNTVYDSSPSGKTGYLSNMEPEDRVHGIVDTGANSNFCQLGEIDSPVTIVGVNCAPEINITGNNLAILNGDTTPSIPDGTDFETICAGSSNSKTFTIENSGSEDLEITAVNISGTNSGDYVVSGITLPITLVKLTSTTFNVTFTSTAPGTRLATVTVNSNDTDESIYSFNIIGKEFSEIMVSGATGVFACGGGNDIINTSSSEIGIEYVLRNDTDNSIVDGPIAGTGNGLTFDTGFLTNNTTFNIFSSPMTIVKNGLKFDGSNESVEIPNHATLNPSSAITLESWVKFDGLGDRKPVIYKPPTNASGEPYYQYEFEVRDNGEVYFALSINGSRKTLRTTGTSLTTNIWNHVACTWDGNIMRIYINGVAYTSTTSASGTLSAYTTNVRLGSHVNSSYGEMELDDVRIWNVARTATEILNSKDSELIGSEIGLVAYYKLNETTGSITTDTSINTNEGSLLNMESSDWITGVVIDNGASANLCTQGELTNKVTIIENCAIMLAPKVFLQGAILNPNTGEETLMRDDLRVAGIIPTTSPYADGLTCLATVFNDGGVLGTGVLNDNIVDWVWVELRDANTNTTVVYSQSALLQRDGDVVDVDGTSVLSFNQAVFGNYYIAIKHRNHLGVMTATAVTLSGNSTIMDFSNVNNQITFGINAQTSFGMPSEKVGLWAGDTNSDHVIQSSGSNSDVPYILSEVLNDSGNFLNFPTYTIHAYNQYDANMDGSVQYSGLSPDTPILLQNVLSHPSNFLNFSTFQILEQLPQN